MENWLVKAKKKKKSKRREGRMDGWRQDAEGGREDRGEGRMG